MTRRRAILIADDGPRRHRLRMALGRVKHLDCAAEMTWDGEFWPVRWRPAPHVFVVEISRILPQTLCGLALLRDRLPGVPVVGVAESVSLLCARDALLAGAGSLVLEESLARDLPLALEAAHTGGCFVSGALMRRLVELTRALTLPDAQGKLTWRERQVWELIAAGRSTKEIATRLHLSTHTVEAHLRNLYRKLPCRSRKEAAHLLWNQLDMPLEHYLKNT